MMAATTDKGFVLSRRNFNTEYDPIPKFTDNFLQLNLETFYEFSFASEPDLIRGLISVIGTRAVIQDLLSLAPLGSQTPDDSQSNEASLLPGVGGTTASRNNFAKTFATCTNQITVILLLNSY